MNNDSKEAAIRIEGLSKSYYTGALQIQVLRDIDLIIQRGEFAAVMGPSGSGKSTLLYLIGGLDKPSSGKLFVGGRELSQMNDTSGSIMRRRSIGFVFQFYNLVPNLNVEENILLPVLLDGGSVKKIQSRLDELLSDVGLEGRRSHTPQELSGGEQQRVAIARALVNEPDIILADEPTGNLDSKTGANILDLLCSIHAKQEKTIVMVTHSRTAADFADRIIQVSDGRILTNGSKEVQDER